VQWDTACWHIPVLPDVVLKACEEEGEPPAATRADVEPLVHLYHISAGPLFVLRCHPSSTGSSLTGAYVVPDVEPLRNPFASTYPWMIWIWVGFRWRLAGPALHDVFVGLDVNLAICPTDGAGDFQPWVFWVCRYEAQACDI